MNTAKASTAVFSHNLMILLKRKGVMPTNLAADLKISDARVDKWIQQVCFPKYELMIQICAYFDYFDIYKLITVRLEG